jgi:hypothetical protein
MGSSIVFGFSPDDPSGEKPKVEEIVHRWARLFPPRDKSRQPLPASEERIALRLKDVQWVAKARERL